MLSRRTTFCSKQQNVDCNCLKRFITSFTNIPTVDVGSLVGNGSLQEQQRAGDELHTACVDVGFFYIKNHGVPEAVVKGVRSVARQFFEQAETTKRSISLSPATNFRGYQSLGANVTRHEDGFQRDWHEAIDLYYEPKNLADGMNKVVGLSPSAIHGSNQWPDAHVPELKHAMNDYVDRMNHVGAAVMRGIALGLKLPDPDFFRWSNQGQDPYWCMRIIHYPPLAEANNAQQLSSEQSDGDKAGSVSSQANAETALSGAELHRSTQLSCGEHTDYGLLTLVNQDDEVSALQVKNAAGEWVTAAPIPGTFVCNIGDMMRVWTNGMYEPTLHRVANADRTRSRVSLPFFYEPSFDAVVTPVTGLKSSRSSKMLPSKHYGRHLESKVFSNFEL